MKTKAAGLWSFSSSPEGFFSPGRIRSDEEQWNVFKRLREVKLPLFYLFLLSFNLFLHLEEPQSPLQVDVTLDQRHLTTQRLTSTSGPSNIWSIHRLSCCSEAQLALAHFASFQVKHLFILQENKQVCSEFLMFTRCRSEDEEVRMKTLMFSPGLQVSAGPRGSCRGRCSSSGLFPVDKPLGWNIPLICQVVGLGPTDFIGEGIKNKQVFLHLKKKWHLDKEAADFFRTS